MRYNVPESCSREPFTGSGGGGVTGCPCGKVSYKFFSTPSNGWRGECLDCLIAQDLRKVRRELRRLNGDVPWWQTQEFKDSMAGGGR